MVSENHSAAKPKILSFAIRKGGVCRTTMVLNISYAAAMKGLKVLMVDIDSQRNLTKYSTRLPENIRTIYDALCDASPLTSAIVPTSHPNLFLIPGDKEMNSFDFALGELPPETRFQVLKRWFNNSPGLSEFDLVTIDMGPALNGSMINALAASTHFIAPVRSDAESLDGLSQLFEEWSEEVAVENPDLNFLGAFLVDFDDKLRVARGIERTLRSKLGQDAFAAVVRSNANFQQARLEKQSIFEYEPNSKVAKRRRGRDDIDLLTTEILVKMGLLKGNQSEVKAERRRVGNE